ncbi:MAG: DUF547 domain-containing protein [Gammaproteobacteria bacterium]|nr:MAG: DUF547 domain-containing protein [Gammaproteobacteria bacterium]
MRGKINLFLALLLAATGALAREPDWSAYVRLLQAHVHPGTLQGVHLNRVDYSALRRDPDFTAAIATLEGFDPKQLSGRKERLAFWINAYNLLAMKVVLDHWPVASIKEVGNFLFPVWKRDAGKVGGKAVTLDGIENEVLRPLGEPRVHMAIVCASIGCPDLRREPYTAAALDGQLDDQARAYLANPDKGLRLEAGVAHVSKIFDWFDQDFDKVGGVPAFLARYAPHWPDPAPRIEADIPYNWSLNGD